MKSQRHSRLQRQEPRRANASPKSGRSLTRREFGEIVLQGGALLAGGVALGGGGIALGSCARERSDSSRSPQTPAHTPADTPAQTPAVPRAVLGRTGVQVSVLGLGTGSLGHQNGNDPDQDKLVRVFSDAIDRGITYVDNAPTYGGAARAVRTVLKDRSRRDRVFLVTKIHAETYAEAESLVEKSLGELGEDHVDLLHLHNLGAKDVEKVLGPGGSWEYFQKAKAQGKARFIGLTGHEQPAKYVRMLETGTVDALMVVMNFVDRHTYRFEEIVLPVARKHGTGVMAMKVYGGLRGGFASYGSKEDQPSKLEGGHERAIAYVRSLEGVTGMVIGVFSSEQVRENIRMVAEARPLAREDFERLCAEGKKLAATWGARLGPPA